MRGGFGGGGEAVFYFIFISRAGRLGVYICKI